MEPRTKQKYLLSSKLLLLVLIILAFPWLVKASESGMSSPTPVVDSLVHNISYDYQLFENSGKLNCSGTLKFSISIPANAHHIVLARSDRRNPYTINGVVNLNHKESIPLSVTEVSKNVIYWNTHFRLFVFLNNSSWISSPLYTISDYVNKNDLELLNQQSSVKNVDIKNMRLYAENKTLYVETHENIVLSVYDLFGNCLFSGDINGTHSVSLKNLSTPFIIVRYSNSVSTTTQKIFVR